MFARQLAQHTQRSPKWFLDRRGFEIGKYRRNLGLVLLREGRYPGVRFRAYLTLVGLRHAGTQ
jgi:hypothetical protein